MSEAHPISSPGHHQNLAVGIIETEQPAQAFVRHWVRYRDPSAKFVRRDGEDAADRFHRRAKDDEGDGVEFLSLLLLS